MRWVLLGGLAWASPWLMLHILGAAYAWQRGERPRWWFRRWRFRRLVLQHAPSLAQWERTITGDPLGSDPFRKEPGS